MVEPWTLFVVYILLIGLNVLWTIRLIRKQRAISLMLHKADVLLLKCEPQLTDEPLRAAICDHFEQLKLLDEQ